MSCEHEGHRERMKSLFLKAGLENLEPHVILELLLFYSVPRRDTNDLAYKLIDRFGSISAVFDAKPEELMKVEGITQNSAVLLSMIPQLARKYLEDKVDTENILASTDDLGKYLLPKFIGRTVETVILVGMDNKNRVISCNIIAQGENDYAGISKRAVMESAIRLGATKVVIAHNHPRGFAVPSSEDLIMTKEIYKLLKSVEIELLDHLIFAEDDYVSLAASGIDFAV